MPVDLEDKVASLADMAQARGEVATTPHIAVSYVVMIRTLFSSAFVSVKTCDAA